MVKNLTLLVVEDHDFQRRTLSTILRSLGVHQVLEASDGIQALEVIRATGPATVDIVLCDLDMPGMDGMELIRHLGQANNVVSVVIVSAKEPALLASVKRMTQAYDVRLLGVIEKPITAKLLRKMVLRHTLTKPEPRQAVFSSTPSFRLDEILRGVQQNEFEPFFQPKVNFVTGQIVGAEALARWRHPEYGIIAPYAFITLLEKSGNIDELTFYILEKAAQACCQWHVGGNDYTVSVNLSLVTLTTDATIAERITAIVRATGLDPRHMILEITESAALSDVGVALENLTRLRMHGFGLSIDDYGTGYASMQQLMRIPFNELKIDQGFVTGSSSRDATHTIIQSSIEMAHQLGIKSVAEGVETQKDWNVLKAAGCDIAQGYFIAKPMEESLFLEFYSKYKPI
tara:strand:- start:103008 stop:104210 length:1203 start_codon:yes stop_codon:yes gene_type:complete